VTRRANRLRVAPPAFRALPLAVVLGAALPATLVLSGCGPEVVRIDRTEGRAMRLFWEDAAGERAAYYEVASDGLFRSGGGLAARDRRTTYRAALSDEEIAAFTRLLGEAVRADATAAATGVADGGDGGLRIDLEFRDAANGWRATRATAPNAALLALRDWCADLALGQFDATIEALPEAGSRRR
jgi:hypothetical protein